MGVHCEINLFKPSDGAFRPGSTVSGLMKYAIDTETNFNKVIIALKGKGQIEIIDEHKRRNDRSFHTDRKSETYVDVECIVHNPSKSGQNWQIGSYELPFNFALPQNIPGSFQYHTRDMDYTIWCQIKYYIYVKFDRPGTFQFAKRLKKEITVISAGGNIQPRLPMEPTIYGEQKKLFKLFSRKPNIVNIKAVIQNSVVPPGGRVELSYEILNETKLLLRSVEIKLIEMYTFNAGETTTRTKDVPQTGFKTGSIASGDSSSLNIALTVPSDIGSMEYSTLVSRDYCVQITAEIPFPHVNAVLNIPLQVVDRNAPIFEGTEEPPPSYWEVMAEDKKSGADDDW